MTDMSRAGIPKPRWRLAWLPALLVFHPPAALAGAQPVEEELYYRWRLGGYKGFLARLVIPGAGDAVLRASASTSGGFLRELHITSPASRRGEFWRYGSKTEGANCGRLVSAWTQQFFRGRAKERRAEFDEDGVLDIPSCICRIRRDPPQRALATRIWSDGRIYPVQLSAPVAGRDRLRGEAVTTQTYEVSGIRRPNERMWKGRLVLVVAMDEERTPLAIHMVQPGLSVRLRLTDSP